ncbi:hypothetical protein CspHIS471_0309930 [Cutaneotrichosporon sp. HIS471]|nr:hypothetical protein CspHIS471_0309930 [Cutaneotrichosporon sp. HIS471]
MARSKVTTPAAALRAPWRDQVDEALKTGPLAREMSLATSAGGHARVRHVTFQAFSPSGFLEIATDRSSGKVLDVEHDPIVEIAWFVPAAGYQFRIRGRAAVIGEAHEFFHARGTLRIPPTADECSYSYWADQRERVFNSLGPMAKKYDHAPPRGARVPPNTDYAHFNFVLVAIVPERVEVLDLTRKGYSTWIIEKGEWVEEEQPPVLMERAHI